ncbi:hypothetical protein [Streptomyces sp. ActVer]|uniref:hypothetical protein n=1 Tax=Streptomyces sp. ActVer TaxID=3014558 RepID=UPI002F965C26
MQLPDLGQRGFAFTAAGIAARINGELTSELYAALRAEGPGRRTIAENAVDDTLDYVPHLQVARPCLFASTGHRRPTGGSAGGR